MMRFLKKFGCLDYLLKKNHFIDAYLALIRPQKASRLTLFPLLSLWCFLSLNGWRWSFFLAIFQKLMWEMLKGFLLQEEPTSEAPLALSTSRWAPTLATMAGLQTSSTPSRAEGLRFRRSWRVPFSRNFLRILLRDLLVVGGGAFTLPHVWAGHLVKRINEEKEKQKNNHLWAYSARIWATSAPWIFFSTKNVRWGTVHSLTGIAETLRKWQTVTGFRVLSSGNFHGHKLAV